jgi:hypothetical protein
VTDPLAPVLGDPFEVSAVGSSLTSIALDIARQAQRLRLLGDTSWTGTASSAARSRIATLPPMLDKAHESYASAGSALASYARSLESAQSSSTAARSSASRASEDLDAARFAQANAVIADSRAASFALVALGPPPVPTAPQYQGSIDEASDRLKRATALNAEAHDDQQAAARVVVAALRQASHIGVRNASWLHRVRHAIGSSISTTWVAALKAASKVGQTIAMAAGLAALVLAFGGAFFPPLEVVAAGFEVASLTGASVAAVADVGLAASGHGPWTAVGVDALSLAPAGLGRLVTKSAPALREGRFLTPTTVVHASSGTQAETMAMLRAKWGQLDTLVEHFSRHGADFGATSIPEYVEQSQVLMREGLAGKFPTKLYKPDGSFRIFDRATDRFGSYNRNLTTKTFFRPDPVKHGFADNWDYWLDQDGEVVSRGAK